ncbi:hypothetical protein M433DRAFT_151717 [Acidomyces richmondensis BFW]|nr:MAG: hypothetical protein FE78DRAFT_86146 [Acidomyces sp. 'richmondensis']KYG47850.1 hypothetical protein M433DRAFT_151717 [Acidomyces richmondensis BFW]
MEIAQHDENDPFRDPAGMTEGSRRSLDVAAVLTVDRNATLTLGTDSLIVLDEGLKYRRATENCCGLLPQLSKTTRAIPFYNILWAELNDDLEITMHYAAQHGGKGCSVEYINYAIADKSLHSHAKKWVEAVMDRAYPPDTKRKKRIKVLINPFGGQGSAQKLWTRQCEPIFAAAKCEVDVDNTAYKGHAIEIAERIDVDTVDVIACASGDGLPHEVFNGLAKQKHPRRALRKVAVTQLPCGSGNAMSANLNGTNSPSLAALAIVKGVRTPIDLVGITQGKNTFYSFLSQSVGIVAESDLGTESLRWMGPFRFTWGFLVRMLGHTIYPAEVSVAVDEADKQTIQEIYRQAVQEAKSVALKHSAASDVMDVSEESGGELPPLKYGTVADPLPPNFQTEDMPTLGNFYVGNMCLMASDAPFFSAALPSDGRMDMISIDGLVSRLVALRMLVSVEHGGLIDFPEVAYRKVLAYRISPRVHQVPARHRLRTKIGRWLSGAGKRTEGYISIDGESVPFQPFQAEVLPCLGTVLSKRRSLYEFEWPLPS